METTTTERIARVVSSLLPQTPWQHRHGPPASLAERMAYYQTPGVSIAVINNGVLEWAEGFGVRAWGEPGPVTPTTLFQAASISKAVFALAVARLAELKRLDLDADVNSYLTSWRVPANDGWQPRVTLRQLLGHRAGMTVHGFPGYRLDEPLPSVPQILDGGPPANTSPVRVNLLPGTQFRYAGGGITVAQQAVVDLLGQPLDALMRELVLDPLAMRDSTYVQPLPAELAGRAAIAHPWKYQPTSGGWHVYPEQAAAGLWTTPSDLARLGIALQEALRGERPDWLSAKMAQEMLTRQGDGDCGLGFFLEGEGDEMRFGHSGWNEGFLSDMKFYAHHGLGAVVMINSNQGAGLLDEVTRAVAGEYSWLAFPPPALKEVAVPPELLDQLVGSYEGEGDFACAVRREGDGLVLEPRGQPPLALHAQPDGAFFLREVNATVSVERSEDGAITGLAVQQGGQRIVAKRQPTA